MNFSFLKNREVGMFSLEIFISLWFIVKTMDAAQSCSWSYRTINVVSSCPLTTDEKLTAEKIKKCHRLAEFQDCSGPSLFKYHCVLNEAGDKFLELCAPEVKIFLGHCATFSTINGRIEQHSNRTCNRGPHPCPLLYASSESYQFPICYGFSDNFTTYEKKTERSNTVECSEDTAKCNNIVIFIISVIYCLSYIITLPFICCRDRVLLCLRMCLRKCIEYRIEKGTIDDDDEGVIDGTPEIIFQSDVAQEITEEEKKTTVYPKRKLHPFPKQISSFCITNIGSINHISRISNGIIWLSNRKHVIKINQNGGILGHFDIDDARGSASHTVDKGGDLLFIKDDTVFKACSRTDITKFLKPKWEILSIYYSRKNDEIILGTYKLSNNTIRSKLSRYNNENGKLIYSIECYQDKQLYALPMFISENINGDICTTDIGTCMVKGVDKLGDLHFYYNGQPTQTEFCPTGICNDAYGHVIVCNRHDANPSVHVLDLRGRFLAIILTAKDGINDPYGLCVDENENLYLGQYDSNTVTVYRYLDEK